ncbi:MAG: cellulase-like family protein [Victivallales bacterium]
MSIHYAVPEHLPKKLTISFWLWNYFYGIKKGEVFHNLEQCFVELKERGFNTIRIDSGAGLCHTADGEPRGQIHLHEPFPGYSTLRQMDQRTDMSTQGGCQCDVLDKVIELFELAKKHDVYVILSSWFYLHTFWFVEDDLVEEFFALPPEKRFMRFAVDTDRILAVLKARGLEKQIAFVEIFNEFDALFGYWKLEKLGKTLADFRRWHEEALDMLKARHPDLLFAIDTCHSGVNREMLPRNAHVWNHHMYYSWGAYTKVFEAPVYESGFDFVHSSKHPVVGRFLRSPQIPIEAVRSCRKYLQYVEQSWPIRVWLYNNLDERKLPELERFLNEHLSSQITEYKKDIDDNIRKALETRKALFQDIILVVGEGATYCAHPKMRWEEKSDAYWELVGYATRRLKEEDYWGCVARTNSGPEDPVWREFPERLQHATAVFSEKQGIEK